jgi:hypothetical protein
MPGVSKTIEERSYYVLLADATADTECILRRTHGESPGEERVTIRVGRRGPVVKLTGVREVGRAT